MRNISENLICVACMAVVATLLLFPMTAGKVPANIDGIFAMPPWLEARSAYQASPPSFSPDIEATRYVPWRVFLRATVDRGDSVLWNPEESCGLPYLALWRSRCLSPFTIPFYVFPLGKAIQDSAWLKLFAAGLCAAYAARRFGLALPMALFVGTAFELSGAMVGHLGLPFSDSLPWLPLLILCADRFSMGSYRSWPWSAAVMALMLLGGEPELAVSAFVLCSVFLTCRMALAQVSLGDTVGTLVLFLASGLAAVALSAVQVIPFVEFLRESASTGRGPVPPAAHLTDMLTCLLPRFFGSLGVASSLPTPNPSAAAALLFYVGMLPVLLLPMWFSVRGYLPPARRQRVDTLLFSACIMLFAATVAYPLLKGIPFARLFTPSHLLAGNAFIVALAAAEAADEWLELDADACRGTLKRFLILLPLMLAVGIVLVFVRFGEARLDAPRFMVQAIVAGLFGVAFVVLLAVTLLRPSTRLMGYCLCVLTCLDLLLVLRPAVRFAEPESLFPSTSFIEALKATGARVSGTRALKRWPLQGNLAPQAYGSSGFRLARHEAFLSRLQDQPLLLRRMGSQALLLTKADIQGPFARVRPKLAVHHVFASGAILFDDLGARPRAWMAYTRREVERFDPSLLNADSPPLVEGVVPPPDEPGPQAEAVIKEESNCRVAVHVGETRPGILVLADSWYPGWKAVVDGVEAPVFPVDGFARGVVVGKGAHDVVFYYAPLSFRLGLTVSALTLVFLVVCVLRGFGGKAGRTDPWR